MLNHIYFSIVNVCKPSHVYYVGGGRLTRPCSQTFLCISEQYSWLAHLVIYEFDMLAHLAISQFDMLAHLVIYEFDLFCTLWLVIKHNHVYSARYFTVNQ